jgi:hypothetical protein
MKKLNGHQAHVIIEGLNMYKDALKQEIADLEKEGKRPFMTQGFVDMDIKEIIELIKANTKKIK